MTDSRNHQRGDETDQHGRADDERGPADDRAIVVARSTAAPPDAGEIAALAEAAGYTVVERVTQRRPADGGYNVGEGKARELARRLARGDVGVVVFDDPLTPGQYRNLTGLFPDGVGVLDRHRLVLDVFADQAGDRAARLQVELARLRYDLPRVRATEERTHMQEAAETGSRVVDIEKRIRTLERKLAAVRDEAAQRRARRRENGFDLVAIAGYTNAGKSTLLHRLADDLSVSAHEPDHADLDGTAEVEDRLFKTLETTTRRATLAGRPVMLTDTVGLVDGLPHDLVAAFSTTLAAVADADVALLVADASDSPATLREKLRVSLDELDDPRGELLVVLNKADLVDDAGLAERREVVTDLLAEQDVPLADDPVRSASALTGDGTEALRETVADALPAAEATVDLPNTGDTQSFLAWAHERLAVETAYRGETVAVTLRGRPAVVERAVERAEGARPGGGADGEH